ncbi:MAG: hypothetical protein J6A69_11235 [Clostridia bacterium]|nr:hypothetical protein [Clostridia bacterium]
MTNLDNKRIKSLIKSDEEVQQFIAEQRAFRKRYLEDEIIIQFGADEPFGINPLKKFFGEEFLKATELPQHKFMLEEEMPYWERAFTYYEPIWKELMRIEEKRKMDTQYGFTSNDLVSDRIDFINRYPANQVRWLSYLHDHGLSKEKWAENFGKNVNRHFHNHLMQIYHLRDEFSPRYTPEFDGTINVLDRERYRNTCRYEAMELMNELYIYNTYMGAASNDPGEI